ncbi:MAG TPA: DNA repair exonuclease [Clostridia bacterium]|nr:DNA repair exonuclease [Clostridia bacterium]
MRILHLADLHLGWRPSFLLPEGQEEIQRERDRLLGQAVDYALDKKAAIDLVIIAGDLFETHRPPRELTERVIRELERLEEGGIRLVTVPGNHDEITYHDSVYRQEKERWPGLLVTNPRPQLVGTLSLAGTDCYVYSMAYTGGITGALSPLTEFPREEAPGFHLAIFHGSYGWDGGERSLPLDPKALSQAGYHYVALGHFHRRQSYKLGGGLAMYPGMVYGKGFHDPGEGSFLVIDFSGSEPGIEIVPVETRNFRSETVDVGLAENGEELAGMLASFADTRLLLELRLTGIAGFPISRGELEARLAPCFYYLEVRDESVEYSRETLERLAGEPTITGIFLRRILTRLAEANDEGERRLLNRALARGLLSFGGDGTGV